MFTVDVESTIGDVVVETTQNKGLSPEYWTERIVNKIVSISDNADPMVKAQDRKSTRLNSSHGYISYAVFCLKNKNKKKNKTTSFWPCMTSH